MSTVSTGLNKFTCMYLDDVLVFSETYDDHLYHLNTVFEKIQKASLKLKLSKCQFFKTHLHYLGHRISANGLEHLPEMLDAIKNLAPTSIVRILQTHSLNKTGVGVQLKKKFMLY